MPDERSNQPVPHGEHLPNDFPDELLGGKRFLKMWLSIFVVLLLIFFLWQASYTFSPAPLAEGQEENKKVSVVILQGTRIGNIKDILASAGIIRDDFRFDFLARLTGVAKGLMAGEYFFYTGMPPYKVVQILKNGRVYYRAVTIPEGWEVHRIAKYLAAEGWVDPAYFMSLASSPKLIRLLGMNVSTLEGYLFPDTYYLSRGAQDEIDIITMMVERFREVYGAVTKGGGNTKLAPHEIITLASIVEKETGQYQERSLVARVFLNRLEKNMPLQADPTVIYGLGKFSGKLTRKDLQTSTPYNTYTRKGLPCGPICNPGQVALEAVLRPATGDQLYFVSRNDGTHEFSETLQQHNRAVSKYQKRQ